MADAFSYFLPDGTPVNAGAEAPPPGTPFYKSEALVPNANGALTSTAAGDASNAFRGFVSADGGGFGGYDSAKLGDYDGTFKQYDDSSITNARSQFEKLGASGVPRLSEDQFKQMTARDSGANAVKDKLARGESVTPEELAFYGRARGQELGGEGPFTHLGAWSAPATESAVPTPNKVRPVPNDPFAAFGADTLPPDAVSPMTIEQKYPVEPSVFSPRILTTAPVEEGYRKFTGRTFSPDAGGGAAPPYSQAAWSGGEMAPSAGSATRPSLSAGRFGRFAPMGGASPFAQKYRQRFKPLGAPANGFTPQAGGAGAPTTQVF